ncbi:lysozyme-like protein [Rhizoclosmatium globosum]|uniref:Lysozyme-like protein n=1 Tax=Rhizoclosmatium globosum TaxID=329046 RepID=A0A1Y2CG49_9FUNG|nr:lysozyme-like protein [Rhizoclosmatium globosum]|eukprot:ORY46043.1 lysozyme-like protein [Rhizoclosmatium globosum]
MSGETVYSAVDIDESTRKGDLANPNEYAEKDDALWASGVPQDTSASGTKTSTTAAPTTNRATSDVLTSATLDVVRTTSQLVVPTTTSSVIPPTTTSEIPTTTAWVPPPPPTTTTSDVPTTSQWVEPQTTAAITTAQQWNDPKATTDVVWTTQAQWVDPKATSDVPKTTAASNNGGNGGGGGGGGGGGSGNVGSIISRDSFNSALSNCGVNPGNLYDGITQGLGISLAGLGELALLLGNMAWESGNFEVTIEQGCGDGSCPGGWKYFGHGFIQLTWEANYQAAASALGRPDIVDDPNIVSNDPDTNWAVSGWYWIQRVQPALQANGYTIGASVAEINAAYECNGNSIQPGRVAKIQCYQQQFGVNVDYNPSC